MIIGVHGTLNLWKICVRVREELLMVVCGCRHFVKNDLPRIRFLNPKVNIEVDKPRKTREETWKPELEVELRAYHIHYVQPK